MKNTLVDGFLTEDMSWNTLMRLISNKQNSSELIKLPVKVFNSVAFKIFIGLEGTEKYIKVVIFFEIFT